jgi:hypothetical protein
MALRMSLLSMYVSFFSLICESAKMLRLCRDKQFGGFVSGCVLGGTRLLGDSRDPPYDLGGCYLLARETGGFC